MAIIRWIGSEIHIFAHLQNSLLIVCFLGSAMGCMMQSIKFSVRSILIPLALLVALLSIPQSRVLFEGIGYFLNPIAENYNFFLNSNQSEYWIIEVAIGFALAFIIIVTIWAIFIPIGLAFGTLMEQSKQPIVGYSLNILGSLLGVLLFSLSSFFSLSPICWFGIVIFALILIFTNEVFNVANLFLLCCIFGGVTYATLPRQNEIIVWTPYQKLSISKNDLPIESYSIKSNNLPFTGATDFSYATIKANPQLFTKELIGYSQYELPYRFFKTPKNVLIIGAGPGNDVAAAIRHGIESITAVEIDPEVINIGKKLHPEQPYVKNKVRVVIDDARSFFTKSSEKFDLIIFGALDAQSSNAGSNTRLDHYVYTLESFQRAKGLLADQGVIFLTFHAVHPFLVDRLATLLMTVFEHTPLTFVIGASEYSSGTVAFIAGEQNKIRNALKSDEKLNAIVDYGQKEPFGTLGKPINNLISYSSKITTDDWPYLYLPSPKVPQLQISLFGMLLILFIFSLKRSGLGIARYEEMVKSRECWHFAALGAAFLLIQTHNINRACIIFGNTWIVSSIIVSAILIMILAANYFSKFIHLLPFWFPYMFLFPILALLYFIDFTRASTLDFALRVAIVGLGTTLPLFFSGLIFINSYFKSSKKRLSLSANLYGSLLGGALQITSFSYGMRSLVIVVFLLYVLSFILNFNTSKKN